MKGGGRDNHGLGIPAGLAGRVAGGAGAGLKFPPATNPHPQHRLENTRMGFFFVIVNDQSIISDNSTATMPATHRLLNHRLHFHHPRTHRRMDFPLTPLVPVGHCRHPRLTLSWTPTASRHLQLPFPISVTALVCGPQALQTGFTKVLVGIGLQNYPCNSDGTYE